jgi:ABC-type transport system involved in multi-copper enzyme maturation permease subunit
MLGIPTYLFRLIPANPILLRVVETAGRRKRDLLIRCAYLGSLILLVTLLLLPQLGTLDRGSLSDLTKQSSQIFLQLSYVQLALVTLLAPIFTAGAITQEKDSQTYDILLATPLTNAQIVLGSLLSRLFFVVTLLLSGLPVFAITQVFGGVAIGQILMSWLIACATAFVTGSVAMAIACLKVGTRRTIFSFYLFILVYVSVPLALESIGNDTDRTWFRYVWQNGINSTSHISWFAGVHPFLALGVIFGDPAYQPPPAAEVAKYGWPLSWYLSSPHTFYVAFMFTISLLLVTPSILLLRRLAQSTTTWRTTVLRWLWLSRGDRRRKPRLVWSNPIAWREARTRGSANRAILLRYGFTVLGLGTAVLLAFLSSRYPEARVAVADVWNPQNGTVTIIQDGAEKTYKVIVPPARNATQVTFHDGQGGKATLRLEDLRPGMVIDPTSLLVANQTIPRLDVSWPVPTMPQPLARQLLLGAMVIELAIIMLVLTQNAASTVTREKEDGTLDLLLVTPITSRYYIWGKLRGLVSFVIPLLAVPLGSILVFVVWDIIRPTPWAHIATEWTVLPEALIVLPGTLIMASAFAAILGMQMSLRCRRTIVAVMASVGIVAGVFGVLWACGSVTVANRGLAQVGVAMACLSPFNLMSLLVQPLVATDGRYTGSELTDLRILVVFVGWVGTAILGLIVWSMYRSMVYNFDMTIRKQST